MKKTVICKVMGPDQRQTNLQGVPPKNGTLDLMYKKSDICQNCFMKSIWGSKGKTIPYSVQILLKNMF